VTELGISPCGEIVRGGERQKVGGKPWQGPRDVRNLRGEGGEHPRPTRQRPPEALLAPVEHQKAFNDAINKSLEQEAADRTGK